jgi:hypothetical protein
MAKRPRGSKQCVLGYTSSRARIHLLSTDTDTISPYPIIIGRFYVNYSMLVINSFGLQNAMERSAVDVGHFFARCHSSATACATLVRDELAPRGFLKYSPDSHFVMISYAVLSLLKVSEARCCVFRFLRSDLPSVLARTTGIPNVPR